MEDILFKGRNIPTQDETTSCPPWSIVISLSNHIKQKIVCCVVRFITVRKRRLGQGNIFTSVCQEFSPLGGVPGPRGCGPGGAWSGVCVWSWVGVVLGGVWSQGRVPGHGGSGGAWSWGVWSQGGACWRSAQDQTPYLVSRSAGLFWKKKHVINNNAFQ